MKDLEIQLENTPGALATMGELLASANVSLEGGGAWLSANNGIAHFLVKDAEAAKDALLSKGISVNKINNVLIQRLKQDIPGQLGKFTRKIEEAGINIEVLYSDHDNQLILVVDDYEKGKVISENWTKGMYD